MNILHITTILPSPVKNKIPANDILIRIAEEYEKKYPEDKHHFLLILPYVNKLLSYWHPKWKEYYDLIQTGEYYLKDRCIFVIGIPAYRNDLKIRHLLSNLGCLLNRNKIARIIDITKPDLIHAHNMANNMELAEIFKRKFSIDFVLTARNSCKYSLNRIKSRKINPKAVLTLSNVTHKECKTFLKNSITMIPHPVDNDFFVSYDMVPSTNNSLSIVTVSSLLKYKNIDRVIRALSLVNFDYSYTIIGDGPEKDTLISISKELKISNKISFVGRLTHNEVIKNLKLFDLFILTSFPETLGRVYFEALASGLPVIASKNTGVDGIIENGINGFIVNPTINDIADALNKVSKLNLEQYYNMKKQAFVLANKYTWDNTLPSYYNFYHSSVRSSTEKM